VISSDGEPIPGLFAAGELVGGIFWFNYPGGSGLTNGSVFGRIAGASAAASRRRSRRRPQCDGQEIRMNSTMRMMLATGAFALAGAVGAQNFPSHPVTLTVGFAPGGGADTAARFIAQKLGREHRPAGHRREQGRRRRQYRGPAHRCGTS
jgi:hypothetical protein